MKSEFVKKTDPLEKAIEIIIRSMDPNKIILFGSRARGYHKKESDSERLHLRLIYSEYFSGRS